MLQYSFVKYKIRSNIWKFWMWNMYNVFYEKKLLGNICNNHCSLWYVPLIFLLDISYIYVSNVIPSPSFSLSWKTPIPSFFPLLLWGCSTHPPKPISPPTIPLHWGIFLNVFFCFTEAKMYFREGVTELYVDSKECCF